MIRYERDMLGYGATPPNANWPNQARIAVKGPYESDDGDVLTNWALEGHGIVLKTFFEVQEHLNSGQLVPVLASITPTDVQMGCLYPHRKRQDPKTRHFMDFMAQHITTALQE